MQNIKVLVGKDRRPFDLPMKNARLTMPSIAAALSELGEEEAHNTLLLPQDDPTIIEQLCEWASSTKTELHQNDGEAKSSLFRSIVS